MPSARPNADGELMKVCPKCYLLAIGGKRIQKDFGVDLGRRDGLKVYCRICRLRGRTYGIGA